MRHLVGLALGLAIMSAAGSAWGKGFVEDREFLVPRSAWSETIPGRGEPQGWWAVGNGQVFGIVGPGLAQAQLHQITGPHIMLANVMNDSSAFGPARIQVLLGGKPVAFTKMTLSKVRGTDVVVMDLVGEGISVTVLNYAPFGTSAILRTVVVTNTSTAAIAPVLVATVGRTQVQDGQLFDTFKGNEGGAAMAQTRQLFSNFIEPAEVAATPDKLGSLTLNLGSIAPGSQAVRTQYLVFSMKEVGGEAGTIAMVKKEGVNLLKKTCDDWQAWMANTTQVHCADQRLVDLINDTKVIVKIQTADPQGAPGPMEFFAGTWVRDSNGPFLYYCRMGNIQAARKMLEFYYRGSAYNKYISNFLPMDIDVSRPVSPDMDWTQTGNDPVEITNWLIMQHRRYWQYTGDTEPIKAHWGYLMKCLMGQLTNNKGQPVHYVNYGSTEPGANALYRFPHHGDETWIYPGFEVLNSAVFPEPCDHPQWDQYSADSTWEFVTSADTLLELAQKIGRPEAEVAQLRQIAKDSRAACERDYWMPEKNMYGPAMTMRSGDVHQPPFAMVNFNPIWIGYLKGDDKHAVSNVLETMKYTMNKNYVTDASETLRVYVGMQPGMFLYNLSAIDHPFAQEALRAMVNVASPSGEYTEKHVTDPTSYRSMFWGHRIRPWEGGINMDAAYYYLTGLAPDVGNERISLCPRMPTDWKEMSVTGQKLGDGLLDVSLSDTGSKRTYTIKWTGTKALTADFKISLPQSKINSVTVDKKPVTAAAVNNWGLTTSRMDLPLAAKSTTVVAVEYAKETVEPLAFTRERYRYLPPKDTGPFQMILWDCEPRKSADPNDVRTFDLLLKSHVNYRLISAANPASADWLRPFLLKSDRTLKTPLLFMTPGSISGSLKYAKWWGDSDLTRLFTEYMNAGGVVAAINAGEPSSEYFGALLGDSGYFTLPTAATPSTPGPGAAKQVCDLLGLFAGDKAAAPKAGRMYVYKNMTVLARPDAESAAATVVAKKYGKGFLLMTVMDLSYQQRAALAMKLADPVTAAAVAKAIGEAKPETVAGAFDDFAKNGSFSDDFKKYKDGSVGLPVWLPLSGTWKMQDGQFHQLTPNGYDFCATANARIGGDYVLEATSMLVDGIYEAGFMFNLPSRFAVEASQMVRFSGGKELWCGPIPFSLEHTLKTGLADKTKEWHTLKITVLNSKGTYDVDVDGVNVGKDLKLTNVLGPGKTGYVALVSCRGHIAYKDIKINPVK